MPSHKKELFQATYLQTVLHSRHSTVWTSSSSIWAWVQLPQPLHLKKKPESPFPSENLSTLGDSRIDEEMGGLFKPSLEALSLMALGDLSGNASPISSKEVPARYMNLSIRFSTSDHEFLDIRHVHYPYTIYLSGGRPISRVPLHPVGGGSIEREHSRGPRGSAHPCQGISSFAYTPRILFMMILLQEKDISPLRAPQILFAFCPVRVKTIPEIWDIRVLCPPNKPQHRNHRSFTSILLIHLWAPSHNM